MGSRSFMAVVRENRHLHLRCAPRVPFTFLFDKLLLCFNLAIAADEVVCGRVVFQRGLRRALKLGNDALSQHFAQLDAPLIEGVDLPDHALREDDVFVERDEFSEHLRRKPIGKNGI